MADSCQRRSCSCDFNQCSRSHISYSQRTNDKVDARCTCPHPPESNAPHGRASVLATRPVRHPSILSYATSVPPVIYEFPLPPCCSPSYSSRPSLPRFHPARNYPSFHGHYGGFPGPSQSRRAPSAQPSSIPSISCRQSYYTPHFNYAQTVHPSCANRTGENAIRTVRYLRAYPKLSSQLFVAEYERAERLRRYPTMVADWTLPSFQPYFSVVYLRSQLRNPLCCDSFRNVCVATIGGRGAGGGPRECLEPYYCPASSCNGSYASGCRVILGGRGRRMRDCHRSCTSSEDLKNSGSIRVSSAPSLTPTYSTFSESLTLENDVYDTGSTRHSSSTRVARRKPYRPERSTRSRSTRSCCSKCRSRSTSGRTRRTSSTPSVVRWVTCEKKRPPCPRHGHSRSSLVSTSLINGTSSSSSSSDSDRESKALRELQDLENFLGLKNTAIDKPTSSDKSDGNTSGAFFSFSGVSTANPICQCPECVATKGVGVTERYSITSTHFLKPTLIYPYAHSK
ncbi:hypothetical protein Y032_0345g3123 [Ancylostoma ceylanicum]|uniref:Uncharacterized protein n=1 Tax=Ancylostoma ceylanicum TaxID=53326 RepID=A0A016RXF3_9BILA|nr:hypothetical protein Y032_0345g3123 [Ancylostoma ceylanicum]